MSYSEDDIAEFKTEAEDLLELAEKSLLKVEKGGPLKQNYDEIFRAFHSLKGAAGMLELTDLQDHMHKIESLFEKFKDKNQMDAKEATFFLESIDSSRKLLSGEKIQFNYSLNKSTSQTDKKTTPAMTKPTETHNLTHKNLVFIVDDEPEILEILKETIESESISIQTFNNPKEALSKLAQLNPSAILSDMKMPEMSGLELLKEIKKLKPELPVIFVSGYLTKENLIEAMKLGLFGVIEKPFKDTLILSTLNHALEKSSLLRLVQKSINLILFQFSDLEEFLIKQGKSQAADLLKKEVALLLKHKRELEKIKII